MGLSFNIVEELACHDASCRPPTSGGTGGSKPRQFSTARFAPNLDSSSAQTVKYEGALRVVANMTRVERENIQDALDYVGTGNNEDIFWELAEEAASIGLPEGMTVGVAAQLAAISEWTMMTTLAEKYYGKVPKLYDAIDRHNAAVEAGEDVSESLARLSRQLEMLTGITVEAGFVSHVNSAWAQSATSMTSTMMHLTAARANQLSGALDSLKRSAPEAMIRQVTPTAEKIVKALHAVHNATYRTTQAELAAQGVTELELYRGVKSRTPGVGEDKIIAQPYPLSSWTTDRGVAERFATNGAVFRARISAESVYSISAVTGNGSLEEREMVVLGYPVMAVAVHVPSVELGGQEKVEVLYVDEDDPDWIKHTGTSLTASATGEYPLARIERNALVALRSLAQRHLSSMGVTAAGIDPLSFITEGMEVEYLTLAMSLWEQVEDALSGFGLDTLPLEDFYAIVKDSVEASRNQYIDTIKSLIGKQSSGTPTYGEFFFVPDYVPGTGLKPPAPYEVQFGDIRSVLGTLGGGGPSEVPLSTGITGGRILQDVLRENGLATNDKLWLYGETARRTFNGHLQVDGLVFSDWRDEALEIAPQDRWLRTDRYRPGDHWGCACVVVPYIPNFGNPFPLTVVADGSTEEFYNPTQPRDKEGQWTTSGGLSEEEKLLDRGVGTGVQVNGSSAWHEVRVTPTEIIQGFNSFKGPLDSTAQVSKIVVMSGRVAVEGKIYAMGKEIGTFERTYERRGMTTRTPFTVINHDSLALSTTSAGIGGAFLRHSVEEYRKQGIKSIVMEAVSGLGANGAYTWAKLGFKLSKGNRTFLSQASRALGKSVKNMDEILSSADGVAWLKGETGENVRWYGEMLL